MKLTPLEIAVLDALAEELVQAVPDIRNQIASAVADRRSNTGGGFLTDLTPAGARKRAANRGLTGIYGTVHADISGLVDPMAFQAVLTNGSLTALRGQTYGEPTLHIDFATAPFWGLFRIAPNGESITVRPRVAARTTVRRATEDAPAPAAPRPIPVQVPAPATIQAPEPIEPDDLMTNGDVVIAGVIAAVVFAAIFAVLFLGLPFFFGLVAVVMTVNGLRNRKVRDTVIKALAALRARTEEQRT